MSRYGALHADSGPGDARPTALQIVRDEALGDKLKGKMAIITGASSGIGVGMVFLKSVAFRAAVPRCISS